MLSTTSARAFSKAVHPYPEDAAHPPHPSQLTRLRPVDQREPEPEWLRGFGDSLSSNIDNLCADLGAPHRLRTATLARILIDATERHGFGEHVYRAMLEERGLPTGPVHSPDQARAWSAFVAEIGAGR